jgi:hypothetical protein
MKFIEAKNTKENSNEWAEAKKSEMQQWNNLKWLLRVTISKRIILLEAKNFVTDTRKKGEEKGFKKSFSVSSLQEREWAMMTNVNGSSSSSVEMVQMNADNGQTTMTTSSGIAVDELQRVNDFFEANASAIERWLKEKASDEVINRLNSITRSKHENREHRSSVTSELYQQWLSSSLKVSEIYFLWIDYEILFLFMEFLWTLNYFLTSKIKFLNF